MLYILRDLDLVWNLPTSWRLAWWLSHSHSYAGSSGSRGGGPRGPWGHGHGPPGPVKTSHKKDGRQRRPHRFHVSWPPPTRPLDPMLCSLQVGFGPIHIFLIGNGKIKKSKWGREAWTPPGRKHKSNCIFHQKETCNEKLWLSVALTQCWKQNTRVPCWHICYKLCFNLRELIYDVWDTSAFWYAIINQCF